MKKIICAIFAALILCASFPDISVAREKSVWVDGYVKKDGTIVKGHYRKAPRRSSSTKSDIFQDKQFSPKSGKNSYTVPDLLPKTR